MKTKTEPDILSDLLKKIDFSADNVVLAAAENPLLFIKAGEYRVRCMRKRTQAKMAMEAHQATLDAKLRKEARESDQKITEKEIERLLTLENSLKRACEEHAAAEEGEEFSKLLVEAFRMRRDCLKIVGDLTRDELSLQKSVEEGRRVMRQAREKMNARFSDDSD